MKDQTDLTIKQRKFLKYYLETGNASKSALKAGYKNACSGIENLEKPIFRAAFEELLDKSGLTDDLIAKTLLGGMKATKIQNVNIVLKKAEDGKLEVQDTDDFIEVDDWPTRHKYLETLLKLKQKVSPLEELKEGGLVSSETFFFELIKKRKVCFEKGEGIKITRVEHRALDKFMAK